MCDGKSKDDDDDEVYGGTRNTTLLRDEGVERPETFDLHCTKVEY